jgi:hypothetical protein
MFFKKKKPVNLEELLQINFEGKDFTINDPIIYDDYKLKFTIQELLLEPIKQDLKIKINNETKIIKDVMPFKHNKNAKTYLVECEEILLYTILNAFYRADNSNEEFKGSFFRIYEKSYLLEMASKRTLLDVFKEENFKHYCFYTYPDIIDIICAKEPEVYELT